jgi:hypothetical protein
MTRSGAGHGRSRGIEAAAIMATSADGSFRPVYYHLSKFSLQLIRPREAPYQDAASRCCASWTDHDRGVVAASSWPKFGGRAEEHPQRGVRGGGVPAAAVVRGRHGFVGPDSPLQRVAAPAKNAHVDLRQPDCRALTVSGPVGDFAYRRAMGRRVCRQDDP